MALRKYFINLGADAGTAMVDSFTGESAMDEEQIAFRRDDALDIELHFLNVNPAEDRQPGRPFIYVDPTGWTVKVGVGTIDQKPTGGTFTLTDSAAAQTTAAIAYGASAATVQAAIRAALTTNFSACTVTGSDGGPWTIDRVTVGAFATDPTGTTAALTPSGSVAVVVNTEDGTASLSEKWQLSLASALPIYKESGWSALPSASVTVTTTQTGLGTPAGSLKNTIFRVQWNADAYAGTVSLRFTGDTSSGTVTLPYNATAAQVVDAFELHTDVDADGVTVVQNGPGDYTIECSGTGIKESAVPALVTAVNTLQVPLGLTARLACNTALVNSLLAGATSATASFEIEVQRSGSNAETVAYRDDATLYADLIRNVAGSSTGTPTYPNVNSVVNFNASITGYTGGGATNLDGIATASTLSAGYYLTFVHATAGAVEYQLVAGTDAESSPDVIRPDDYNASTNAKVWKLKETGGDVVGPASATNHAIVRFDGTTGKLVKSISSVTVSDAGWLTMTDSEAQLDVTGISASIAVTGADSSIQASGTNSYVMARAAFKLWNGTYFTTIAHAPTASYTVTLVPTGDVTMTLPSTSFAAARTDAAQTFTGLQTIATGVALPDGAIGTATAAVYFTSDTDTGWYRSAANTQNFFCGGLNVLQIGYDGTNQTFGISASPLTRVVSTGEQYFAMQNTAAGHMGIRLGNAAAKTYIRAAATPSANVMEWQNSSGTVQASISSAFNFVIGTGKLIVSTSETPASASATGTAGTIAWDSSYIYVCTATDTWKRVAIATW